MEVLRQLRIMTATTMATSIFLCSKANREVSLYQVSTCICVRVCIRRFHRYKIHLQRGVLKQQQYTQYTHPYIHTSIHTHHIFSTFSAYQLTMDAARRTTHQVTGRKIETGTDGSFACLTHRLTHCGQPTRISAFNKYRSVFLQFVAVCNFVFF